MATNGTIITFYGTVELKERLERTAKEQDRSVSNIIRRALEQQLDNPETKTQTRDNGAAPDGA